MTDDQVQPDPAVWPECSECGAAYVLRRCIVFSGDPGYRWFWQRDCKHKKAEARIARREEGA